MSIVLLGSAALVTGRVVGDDTAPATTTTTSATTAGPTTTTAVRTTVASTTTLASAPGTGPVLPAPSGESAYALSTSGDLFRLDLDTGSVLHTDLGRGFASAAMVASDAGVMVVPGGNGNPTEAFLVDGAGRVATFTVPITYRDVAADPAANGVWLVVDDGAGSTYRLLALDGTVGDAVTISTDRYFANDGFATDGNGFLVSSPWGVYRVDVDGVRRVTTGSLVAASPQYLVERECDDAFRCTAHRVDRSTGRRVSLGAVPPELATVRPGAGSVSPDGTEVAVVAVPPVAGRAPYAAIWDTRTHRVHGGDDGVGTGASEWTASSWAMNADLTGNLLFRRGDDSVRVDMPSRAAPAAAIAVGPTPTQPAS